MKEVIKPEEARFICDLCGEEIEQNAFQSNLVDLIIHDVGGNGWNEWPKERHCHLHKSCLDVLLELAKDNGVMKSTGGR